MKNYFYPGSLYTSITAFADLFNNMSTRVFDKDGRIVGVKPVITTLAPKEKLASLLLKSDVNDIDPKVDNYLPRISINPIGYEWDSKRQKGFPYKRRLNIEYYDQDEIEGTNRSRRVIQTDIEPIPYNISFDVVIWTKYDIDMKQILENILPWFAPEVQVSVKERNFGLERKEKVTLTGISPNNVIDLDESGRRILMTNLTFSMETVLYKPIELSKEILCSIISISVVPCEKRPFEGDKIIAKSKEDETGQILTDEVITCIQQLDGGEEYDLMAKYWAYSNTTMNPPEYSSCLLNCNNQDNIERPYWDLDKDGNPDEEQPGRCEILLKQPKIIIDPDTNNINNYYQSVERINNNMVIISYVNVWSEKGVLLSGPTVIANEDYPE